MYIPMTTGIEEDKDVRLLDEQVPIRVTEP
jgi:hypothetical protein